MAKTALPRREMFKTDEKAKPAKAKATKGADAPKSGPKRARLDPGGPAVQLNVRIPPALMKRLDRHAKKAKQKPVEIVRAALDGFLP